MTTAQEEVASAGGNIRSPYGIMVVVLLVY